MKKRKTAARIDLAELFAENLPRRREAQGLSQSQLAARAGIHASHVSMLESGKSLPSLSMIQHLAEAMGLDPRTFFRERP